MIPKYLATASVVLTLSWAAASQASVTTYTDESAWIAAAGPYYNEPFDVGGLQSFTGVTTTNGSIGSARGSLSGSVWNDRIAGTDSTTFSYIPADIIAAGATWDTSPGGEGSGLTLTLNLAGGGTEQVAQIGPIDGTFFGFVSTDAFSSFSITLGPSSGQETYDLDNLHFAVPEPASVAVLGFGLVALGRMRRRKIT